MTIWERLGIAPTTDQKAIKKAYAAKVKECHQEDEPERWMQLHNAYKSALKYAESASGETGKAYTGGWKQESDFRQNGQAQSVYHSTWEQSLPPKEEKPKSEAPKEEEPKPQKPKEEPNLKPQKPKEEPKPEAPKEKPKEEPKPQKPKEEPNPKPQKPKEEPKPEPPKEKPKEEPKPKPRKEEEPKPRKAEPKPKPLKEEAKPEAPKEKPKEEPKPEPPKEEPKPEAPKEESKPNADRELESFFDHLMENAKESEQKFMKELRVQLEELSCAAPHEEADKWKTFLESQISQILYRSEDYWSAVLEIFYRRELQGETYNVIYEELKNILAALSIQLSMVSRGHIEKCIKVCEKHIKEQKEIERKKRQTQNGIGWVFGVICVLYLLSKLLNFFDNYYGSDPTITSHRAVKTQLASYLNDKYSTQEYQADEFELEKLYPQYIYANGSGKKVEVGYRVTLPNQPDFCALVLFKYDNQKNVQGSVCFDNVQRDEIERKMEEEVKSCLELPQAIGYLSAGEGDMVAGTINPTDVAYHTFFTGDLRSFTEDEKNVRRQISQIYTMIDTYARSGEMNGSFILYYPDEQVTDIDARLTMDSGEGGQDVAEKLETLQEELHIQMIAVGMPQSYYDAVFTENTQSKEEPQADMLRDGHSNTDLTVPINPAFVSVWFMAYHSKESVPTESSLREVWVHTPEVMELEEGVYAFSWGTDWYEEEKSIKDVLRAEVDESEGRLFVNINEESYEEYVIVLDKQILGIGEEYTARLVEPEDTKDTTVYDQYPYDYIEYSGMYYNIVLDGEDKLFLNYSGDEEKELEVCW